MQIILAGRAPLAPNEVAVGTKTMRSLHVHLGDVLHVTSGSSERLLKVVGRGLIPNIGYLSSVVETTDGLLLTADGLKDIDPSGAPDRMIVRLAEGTSESAGIMRLAELGIDSDPTRAYEVPSIASIRRAERFGNAFLALIALGLGGVAALGQWALAAASRRDLSILHAIGLTSSRLRAALAAHAAGAALGVAVTGSIAGAALARFGWDTFIHHQGFLAEPRLPIGALAVLLGSFATFSTAAGWIAGITATRPRTVQAALRAE
jgi:hypothetical protein